jgi:hypothetical protein
MTYDQWGTLIAATYFGGILIWGLGLAFLQGADMVDEGSDALWMLAVVWPVLLLAVFPFGLAYWLGTKVAQYCLWRERQK